MNELQREIYGCLSTEEWIIQPVLLENIKAKYGRSYKSRRLRELIRGCRMMYKEGNLPLLVIKSNKGYKLSDDMQEITLFCHELIATGESMTREGRELLMAAQKKEEKIEHGEYEPVEDYSRDMIESMIEKHVFSHAQLIEITKGLTAGLSYQQVMLYANENLLPYVMFLARKGLMEGMDMKTVRIYTDASLNTINVLKLHRAAQIGEDIGKLKEEMRVSEIKKID